MKGWWAELMCQGNVNGMYKAEIHTAEIHNAGESKESRSAACPVTTRGSEAKATEVREEGKCHIAKPFSNAF